MRVWDLGSEGIREEPITRFRSALGFLAAFSLFLHRKMMEVCGEAENRLASELMQHELQIEKDVLDPLSQLAEVRGPSEFHF